MSVVPDVDSLTIDQIRQNCHAGRGGWTVDTIKGILRKLGLAVSGNKTTLCDRLMSHVNDSVKKPPTVTVKPPKPPTVTVKPPKPPTVTVKPPKPSANKPPTVKVKPPSQLPIKPTRPGVAVNQLPRVSILPTHEPTVAAGETIEFLRKINMHNKVVCHPYSVQLEETNSPLVLCLPVMKILENMEKLAALLKANLTPEEYAAVDFYQKRYYDWMILAFEKRGKIGKTLVVKFDEEELRDFVVKSVPFVYELATQLTKTNKGTSLLLTLLNEGRTLDGNMQSIMGKWPIGVMIRVINSMANAGHPLPGNVYSQFQALVHYALLPDLSDPPSVPQKTAPKPKTRKR